MNFVFWMAIGAIACVIFASFFEWAVHRFLMHRPLLGFSYPFKAHAIVHHQVFKADHTYHVLRDEYKKIIPMAWWNGPVLVLLGSSPFAIISSLTGNWGLTVGAAIACASYYGTYEYLHWCMHLPRRRSLERSGVFFRLNGHHLLHHRYMHKNFNVVFPLADLCLGTLMLRSAVRFAQAMGPAVPDVQPREVPVKFVTRIFGFVRQCLFGVKGA